MEASPTAGSASSTLPIPNKGEAMFIKIQALAPATNREDFMEGGEWLIDDLSNELECLVEEAGATTNANQAPQTIQTMETTTTTSPQLEITHPPQVSLSSLRTHTVRACKYPQQTPCCSTVQRTLFLLSLSSVLKVNLKQTSCPYNKRKPHTHTETIAHIRNKNLS